ncbi:MAG: hypothetical protein DRR15_10855 [Gammaproteobacteria bacterium]|nr:MAG: hypothetical protein DRR15_10855 [Gammaproteobacteria bacterium]
MKPLAASSKVCTSHAVRDPAINRKANTALALRDIFMMLFATGIADKMMIKRHLMVSFQVLQNATTVTLLTSGNCRQTPTTAGLQAADHVGNLLSGGTSTWSRAENNCPLLW